MIHRETVIDALVAALKRCMADIDHYGLPETKEDGYKMGLAALALERQETIRCETAAFERGQNDISADFYLALDWLPFDWDGPQDLSGKLKALLLDKQAKP